MTEVREPRTAGGVVVAWLTHPVTCLALVVLLVNDHVLKAAWGNTLTGKLSDFAWLLVAPPLLASLVLLAARMIGAKAPRGGVLVGASLGVTGAVFVFVKVTTVGAAAASTVLSVLAGSSVVLRDPTDLVALAVLWLGWRVARPTSIPRRSQSGRPGWRWMAVLPIAVIATAATSVPPPQGTARFAVIEDMIVVQESYSSWWFVSTDGLEWDRIDSREPVEELQAKFDAAGGTLTEACVPGEPLECYRAGDGLGVDRSDDGGSTWVTDWSVPQDVVEELAARYRPRVDGLWTVGVAIWPTATGYQVWAANHGDGLAVRHEDGAWERLGFVYESDPSPVVPLPGEPTRMAYPVPLGLPIGIVVAWLVPVLGSAGRPRRAERSKGQQGMALAVAGVVLAVVAMVANGHAGAVVGQEIGSGLIFGGLLAPAGVSLLVVLALGLVFGGVAALGHKRFVGPVLFTVVGVTLAAELSSPVLAVVVSAAVVAGAAVVARRLGARREPEPPFATDYWA